MNQLKPWRVVGKIENINLIEVRFANQSEAQMYAQSLRRKTINIQYSVEVDSGVGSSK